jgi:ABC-2 type transport system ATP-binding protein
MLIGVLEPTAGRAVVGGHDVARQTDDLKRSIGYMSQKFSLYDDLTVRQNIRLFGGVHRLGRAELNERETWVMEMAGLTGREDDLTRTLSGGWKQRLALGCAIIHEPEILFLDEPTGGVDPLSRRHFWRLIDEMSARGVTVLVTTHYMDEAEHCHRLALMHAGRLAALGTLPELQGLFAGHPIVEIEASPAVEAMRVLDSLPEVEDTSLFGTSVHAVLRGSGHDTDRVTGALAKAGVDVQSARVVQPSLEDIFLRVVEQEESRGGPGGQPGAGVPAGGPS